MVSVIFPHTPPKILERTEQKKGFRRNLGHSNSILYLKSSQVSSGKRGTLPPRKWVGALFCSIQSILYSYLYIYIYWIDEFWLTICSGGTCKNPPEDLLIWLQQISSLCWRHPPSYLGGTYSGHCATEPFRCQRVDTGVSKNRGDTLQQNQKKI